MREPAQTDRKRSAHPGLGWWTWGATGLGLVALLVFAASWGAAGAPTPSFCLFRLVTGVSCPACGLTRAFAAVARGRFTAALALHPAWPVLALESGVVWLVWGLRLASRRRLLAGWEAPAALLTASGLVLLWIARLLAGTLPP